MISGVQRACETGLALLLVAIRAKVVICNLSVAPLDGRAQHFLRSVRLIGGSWRLASQRCHPVGLSIDVAHLFDRSISAVGGKSRGFRDRGLGHQVQRPWLSVVWGDLSVS